MGIKQIYFISILITVLELIQDVPKIIFTAAIYDENSKLNTEAIVNRGRRGFTTIQLLVPPPKHEISFPLINFEKLKQNKIWEGPKESEISFTYPNLGSPLGSPTEAGEWLMVFRKSRCACNL